MIHTMAQAKTRKKAAARGAAKRSQTNAALARARNPAGVRASVAASNRRARTPGTVISPSAMRALDAEARRRGEGSAERALSARGSKRVGTITSATGRAGTYAKRGGQG